MTTSIYSRLVAAVFPSVLWRWLGDRKSIRCVHNLRKQSQYNSFHKTRLTSSTYVC